MTAPIWLLLTACTGSPETAATLTVTARPDHDIHTLLNVSWDPPVHARVETTRGTAEGEGSAVVFGYPADTEVELHVVADDGSTGETTATTGSLPAEAPPITVGQAGSFGADYLIVGWQEFPAESTGTFILDADGQVVWYWMPAEGITPTAHYIDGELLIVHTAHDVIQDAQLVRAGLLGGREAVARPYVHHEAIPIPGGIAAVVGEVREVDGEMVVGDRIVEYLDSGEEREVWNAFDHFPVEHHTWWGISAYTEGTDWSHFNGLDYDEEEDVYYASSLYLQCVVKIDRGTGETRWVLGGDHGTLAFTNDGGPHGQHGPEWVDGELVLFDNNYSDGQGSRLARFRVDEEAGTAERTWELRAPDGAFSLVFGDVDTTPDGGHLSAWGNQPYIRYYDPDDSLQFEAELPVGYIIGQVETFDR